MKSGLCWPFLMPGYQLVIDHSNELVFNWRDHETKVTENDFNKFVSSVNRSLLPVGITFKMK